MFISFPYTTSTVRKEQANMVSGSLSTPIGDGNRICRLPAIPPWEQPPLWRFDEHNCICSRERIPTGDKFPTTHAELDLSGTVFGLDMEIWGRVDLTNYRIQTPAPGEVSNSIPTEGEHPPRPLPPGAMGQSIHEHLHASAPDGYCVCREWFCQQRPIPSEADGASGAPFDPDYSPPVTTHLGAA
jgi:hypothetical protein